MSALLRVLIVDDAEDDARLVLHELRRAGYEPMHARVDDAGAMRAALDRVTWDVVLCDYLMPRFTMQGAMELLRLRGLEVPFIVVSGQIGEETAVAAMKAGAHDYVMKNNLSRLAPAIEREVREARSRFDDVTEHRRLEEQLRHAQKMEAIGRLAGGVAHDFNNLLTAIIGFSELVLARMRSDDPMRGNLEEIRKAADRATALTRQLLAFGKRQVMRPRVLDVNAVVADLDRLLRRLIGEDVALATRAAPEPALVLADPGQLEQVIVNLVVNARDAMPTGGAVTIETATVDLDEDAATGPSGAKPGPYVRLSVGDTGIGMDAATQAHLFEPFFTTKMSGKGTGLGLSTVYGIVTQSGGHIAVDSEPGRGAVFLIYLPQVLGVAEAVEGARPAAGPLDGSETILIVEDEDGVRALVRHVLAQRGYTMLEASSQCEADRVEAGHRGVIDLLVTDVVMPGVRGPELAKRMLDRRPGLKVLYMSGYSEEMMASGDLAAAGVAFLQKPFTPTELAGKIREVLKPKPGT